MAKRQNIPEGEYLKGLNDVLESIQNAVDRMERKSVKGLAKALIFVGDESQQRAPVETGDLRGSLEITIDGVPIAHGESGGGITQLGGVPEEGTVGTISYNTPYAATQHEHTEYDHPLGGQAKYLESVLQTERDTVLRLIADEAVSGQEE